MSYVAVKYDRVNATQNVAITTNVVEVPDETIFSFEWRRYRQGEYDPSSDGIGATSDFQTVKGDTLVHGSLRVVPGYQSGDASTSLAFGIDAVTTEIPVSNLYTLPTAFPYIVTVGTDEKMLVTGSKEVGAVLLVVRGYDGTVASIHEAGEGVEYKAAEVPEEEPVEATQPPPQEIPWPSGEAYARKLLEKLSRPKRQYSVRLANVGGDWSTVQLGSRHTLDIQTEGQSTGIMSTVRVLGFAPDYMAGSMELIVEDV